MKKILSLFLVFLFSLSTFWHSVGIVFADNQKETHCHEESTQKNSWDCCLVSKDFSSQNFQASIEVTKILKKLGGDTSFVFPYEEVSLTQKAVFSKRKKYFTDPPPNDYTSLIGIIKQLK